MGVSAPAPPLSFLQSGRGALSGASLSVGPVGWSTAAASARMEKSCAQAMGLVEGLTMQRQSRSPRARPSTSISAVAMLLAKGMLF